MLILTRKTSESIIIGDEIKVYVLEVKGSQVRIGIEAPKDVTIHREEIYERIQEALNKKGSENGGDDDSKQDE